MSDSTKIETKKIKAPRKPRAKKVKAVIAPPLTFAAIFGQRERDERTEAQLLVDLIERLKKLAAMLTEAQGLEEDINGMIGRWCSDASDYRRSDLPPLPEALHLLWSMQGFNTVTSLDVAILQWEGITGRLEERLEDMKWKASHPEEEP